MADSDGIFTLESAAKRGPGNYVRMRPAQVNARAIGLVFNLFPESVLLVADDGSVELPDDDGCFQMETMDSSMVWTCDGDSSKSAHQGSQWQQQGESQLGPSGFQYAYQPTDEQESMDRQLRQCQKCNRTEPRLALDPTWIKKVEICTLQGSQLKKWFNLTILLTESSATVGNVAECVSEEAFDGDEVILLDSGNTLIGDSIVTRG